MCVALISTAHPKYALILIDNRDVQKSKSSFETLLILSQEYLGRPTAPAGWWEPPNQHVLAGRDLQREVHGTWFGVTKDGRVAVLTNFRDDSQPFQGVLSRGAIVNAFLTPPPGSVLSTADFVERLLEDGVQGVGGFSLVCGRAGKPLAVISNRTPSSDGITWIATGPGETVGLSNAAFGDRSWPKVVDGERLLAAAIDDAVNNNLSEEELIEAMLKVLSSDTLPRLKDEKKTEELGSYLHHLRTSIFIPPIGGEPTKRQKGDEIAAARDDQPIVVNGQMSGTYGTQKQSVLLVDYHGQCTFFERSLFEAPEAQDRRFFFNLEL